MLFDLLIKYVFVPYTQFRLYENNIFLSGEDHSLSIWFNKKTQTHAFES